MLHKKNSKIAVWCAAIAILLLLSLAVFRASLSYLGYCSDAGARLSDNEKIQIAIKEVLSSYPPALSESLMNDDGQKVIRWYRPERPIYYQTTKEFLAMNPSCCYVTDHNKGDFGQEGEEISFIKRVINNGSLNVRVKYKVRYFDHNGSAVSSLADSYVAVSNCKKNKLIK